MSSKSSTWTAARPSLPDSPATWSAHVSFKDDIYPIVRFNTHDVSRERTGASAAGYRLRRIEGFLGRSDNMVKIKGINVFPHAIGPLLAGLPEFLGEFVCRVTPDGAMTVVAEVRAADRALAPRMRALLKDALGIEVGIELVSGGATAVLTQVDQRQKPIRLIDERQGRDTPAPGAER